MEILRIKEILKEKGWNTQRFATEAGISYTYASEVVRNVKFPRKETLYTISQVLNVDIRELFISTKEKDMSDPVEAIKVIKRIANAVNTD